MNNIQHSTQSVLQTCQPTCSHITLTFVSNPLFPISTLSLSEVNYNIPRPMVAAICVITSGAGFSKPRVAATPALTPIIPSAFPEKRNKRKLLLQHQL